MYKYFCYNLHRETVYSGLFRYRVVDVQTRRDIADAFGRPYGVNADGLACYFRSSHLQDFPCIPSFHHLAAHYPEILSISQYADGEPNYGWLVIMEAE